jgi:hypothetical protein
LLKKTREDSTSRPKARRVSLGLLAGAFLNPATRPLQKINLMEDKDEKIKELTEALKSAVDHLEWIGYGDAYERSCAHDSNLPNRLNAVLDKHQNTKTTHIKERLLNRIVELRIYHNNFNKSSMRWKTFTIEGTHVSEVKFEELPDWQLIHAYERILKAHWTQM